MIRSLGCIRNGSGGDVQILQMFGRQAVFCRVNSRSAGMKAPVGSVVDTNRAGRASGNLDPLRATAIGKKVHVIVSQNQTIYNDVRGQSLLKVSSSQVHIGDERVVPHCGILPI
jgi:hypothetical protein